MRMADCTGCGTIMVVALVAILFALPRPKVKWPAKVTAVAVPGSAGARLPYGMALARNYWLWGDRHLTRCFATPKVGMGRPFALTLFSCVCGCLFALPERY